jgi:hypothetical protein
MYWYELVFGLYLVVAVVVEVGLSKEKRYNTVMSKLIYGAFFIK